MGPIKTEAHYEDPTPISPTHSQPPSLRALAHNIIQKPGAKCYRGKQMQGLRNVSPSPLEKESQTRGQKDMGCEWETTSADQNGLTVIK
jgi:hypothetical protein